MPKDRNKSNNLEIVEDQIFEAIGNKDLKKVEQIVRENSKVNLNFVDKDELSPLQHACHIGDVEFTRFLLDNGADVNYTDRKDRYTPLMFAAISSKEDVVKLLLERGVDTTAENSVKRTASQMAAFVGLHKITGIINAWLPYETTVEPYTKCRELEDIPRLPSKSLGRTLHKYIVSHQNFPIKLFLHMRENLDLIEHGSECIYVLESLLSKTLSPKASKLCPESLPFRYHYLSYFLGYIMKDYWKNNSTEGQPENKEFDQGLCEKHIDAIVRRFLRHKHIHSNFDSCDVYRNPELEKIMLDCVLKFPYTDLPFFRNIIAAMEKATGISIISLVIQMLGGMISYLQPEACFVCNDAGKNKKCSKCKSVWYCGPLCQQLDWFRHKKVCKSPEETPLMKDTDST